MAREMGLHLARLNVTVGVAKLDGVSKSDATLKPLIAAARAALAAAAPSTVPGQPAGALVAAGAAAWVRNPPNSSPKAGAVRHGSPRPLPRPPRCQSASTPRPAPAAPPCA